MIWSYRNLFAQKFDWELLVAVESEWRNNISIATSRRCMHSPFHSNGAASRAFNFREVVYWKEIILSKHSVGISSGSHHFWWNDDFSIFYSGNLFRKSTFWEMTTSWRTDEEIFVHFFKMTTSWRNDDMKFVISMWSFLLDNNVVSKNIL